MKTFALFNMVASYMCVIICVVTVVYSIAFTGEYANAFIMSLAGFAMFMIAETLKNEWRQGKL